MITLLVVLVLLVITFRVFTRRPVFGRAPSGARLEQIKNSPNYKNGQFQNLHPTPNLTEGVSFFRAMKDFALEKNERTKPATSIPSQKTDLLNLAPDANVLVWFGHSSYFIQIDGKKILVDPVLSGAASPLSFTTRAFKGKDRYTTNDIPETDYLFISHDLNFISLFAQEVVVMENGRIVERTTPEKLAESTHPATRELVEAAERLHAPGVEAAV